MIRVISDKRLVLGFFLAHLVIFLTFEQQKVFWYFFTAAMLLLISYSILDESGERNSSKSHLLFGIITGVILYAVFWLGDTLIGVLNLPLEIQITRLYKLFSPETVWHYIVLLLVIGPGEEIFWRGFIQRKLHRYTSARTSIIISTLLYASVQIYSGEWVLFIAALTGGLVWGALYAWKKSIRLVVISHIVFDLLMFGLLPLR
ncbi:CPBP family intramembrane metalloprotease [Mesobacillus maritimus]|uniref:CPBP family intramembrane glutamic endopeptidase n=1 Tax=Mesobacillus maritimus TaxID=1643336 RepID=UPI00203A3AF5|nr:type II CAAX endopeptidase family protein [Mesobacillus maritimus]MCM3586240.1 CPBP family intramembrane metalloprotease [Mesobacillus maritimus]